MSVRRQVHRELVADALFGGYFSQKMRKTAILVIIAAELVVIVTDAGSNFAS
ncbi:MAG: hypothetical protein IJV11_09035 [Muribaculaceae bacterium]|nr:hypothetical protein [Muribaculaceae bacterium]